MMKETDVIRRVDRLSDKHNGGQTASMIETQAGKFILKPRSPRTDIAWADFLDALAAMGLRDVPRYARPVAPYDEGRTLAPFIENTPAQTEDDARAYYRRCGALLALCELLGATDLHAENLVACGDSPILVDLETLLAGKLPDRGQYEGGLSDSLMYSHLLPNWALDGDENRDIGALTGEGKNRLTYRGAPCPAYHYADEIVAGYCDAYDFLLSHREQVACALRAFDSAQFRKLLRPTEVYGRLVDRIEATADEAEKQRQAERLRRAYARDPDPAWTARMQAVCQSEIDAVLRGDIPYFFSYGDETCLRDWRGVVCDAYFALSPVDNARLRLRMLDERDKRDQARVIRQALRAVNPALSETRVSSARAVYDMLEAQALENNPCSWIGVDTDDKGRAYLQSIGFGLYGGLLGVLCFYAALFEATGDETIKRAIERRYAKYRAMYIEAPTPLPARADNVNLTHGVGGHILAHAYLARCLGDARYLEDAAALFSRFEFEGFSADSLDVYGGVSGLLVALPRLMGQGIDEPVQRVARLLADIVCQDTPALTGYAHGAAGEALALAAAQTVLGDRRYEDDILRMLAAENEHYDARACNWADLRDPEKQGFMQGLCSGAPGVGLARKQMLSYAIGEETRAVCLRDIERVRAYYAAVRAPLKRDSLCCGNAARMAGERAACGEIQTSGLNEAPVLFHPLDSDDFPAGLFQGWAGVGYALARRMPASRSDLFIQ